MSTFNEALDSVIQDADEHFDKIQSLSNISLPDLLSAFVDRINKQQEVGLNWTAVCRVPSNEMNIDESWPMQLKEFYGLCDGVDISTEGDGSIFRSVELVLGENHKPKLSTLIKPNLERTFWRKGNSLPIFEAGGTQSLLKLMSDEPDLKFPVLELDKHLILQSDQEYNFLVCLINDIGLLKRGSIIEIEGGVGTSFTSLREYLAFHALLFEDW